MRVQNGKGGPGGHLPLPLYCLHPLRDFEGTRHTEKKLFYVYTKIINSTFRKANMISLHNCHARLNDIHFYIIDPKNTAHRVSYKHNNNNS